jgi:hypothetical protein
MRNQAGAGVSLMKNGLVLCDGCLDASEPIDRKLMSGDTYAGDPCDVCGRISQASRVGGCVRYNAEIQEMQDDFDFIPLKLFLEKLKEPV